MNSDKSEQSSLSSVGSDVQSRSSTSSQFPEIRPGGKLIPLRLTVQDFESMVSSDDSESEEMVPLPETKITTISEERSSGSIENLAHQTSMEDFMLITPVKGIRPVARLLSPVTVESEIEASTKQILVKSDPVTSNPVDQFGGITPIKSTWSNGNPFLHQWRDLKISNKPIIKKPNTQKVLYSIDMDQYMNTPINKPPSKASTASMQRVPQPVPITGRNTSNKENPPDQSIFKIIKVKQVNYYVLKQLGRGGSSIVYDCYEPLQQLNCAIKVVNLNQDQGAVAGFLNEVKMLQQLQKCSRVIKLYSHVVLHAEKKMLMVLEKGGKDLAQILKDIKSASTHIPMYMVLYYWMGMLYAVKDIHDNGIIHSDLKPANFLEIDGKIKLIDFGISSMVQNDKTSVVKHTALGTFSYISPEALHNEGSNNCDSPSYGKAKYKISYKSDVWSLGCILYELVYKKTPFQHVGHTWAKLSLIMDPNHKIEYPPLDWVPRRIINTIKHCMQYDMRSRPSIDDLITHYEQLCN